jgi:hypothetical protein
MLSAVIGHKIAEPGADHAWWLVDHLAKIIEQ